MEKNNLVLIALLFTCLLFNGCSFSTSSESSSDLISSPSKSSGGQEGESVKKTSNSYQEDVAVLTILYVGSTGSSMDYERELTQISNAHGIVDWESKLETFEAIGDGLKRAKVSKDSIETLPFLQGVSNSPHYSQMLAYY